MQKMISGNRQVFQYFFPDSDTGKSSLFFENQFPGHSLITAGRQTGQLQHQFEIVDLVQILISSITPYVCHRIYTNLFVSHKSQNMRHKVNLLNNFY